MLLRRVVASAATACVLAVAAASGAPAVAAGAQGLALRADGIGALSFGSSEESVIDALSAALGPPSSDRYGEFPTEFDGLYHPRPSSSGTIVLWFEHPVGRWVCWSGSCAIFGGESRDSLAFRGYFVRTPEPTMRYGLGVGSRLSDFPGLPSPVADTSIPCRRTAAIAFDGVTLWLRSESPLVEEWVDGDGVSQTRALPQDRSQIEVSAVLAGAGNSNESCIPALDDLLPPTT